MHTASALSGKLKQRKKHAWWNWNNVLAHARHAWLSTATLPRSAGHQTWYQKHGLCRKPWKGTPSRKQIDTTCASHGEAPMGPHGNPRGSLWGPHGNRMDIQWVPPMWEYHGEPIEDQWEPIWEWHGDPMGIAMGPNWKSRVPNV